MKFAAISQASFHYQDKIRPIDYVVKIAYNMQFYLPKDWLAGLSLPSKFNPERIQSALKDLSPFNVRIFWESSKFEGLTNSKEPWNWSHKRAESPLKFGACMTSHAIFPYR